jgi:DNA polymerase
MNILDLKKLYKNAKLVPGEGPLPCELLLIGEAPGEKEDKERRPFVGDCGELINEILNATKLPRRKVRITNAVKQRPPKNRKPTFEEILAHRSFLMQEIKECEPRAIILLGKTAAQAFFKEEELEPIWRLRKKLFYNGSQRIFVTYHPGAALRSDSNKELLKKDIERVVHFLKEV